MERKSSFNTYLNAIGRVPLLTPKQEIELGRRVQRMKALQAEDRPLTDAEKREVRSGERAVDRFMQSNLRLVVNVAKKYVRSAKSMDLMDLIQEGNIGLMTAVRKFDPAMGYKFSTYAYWWIKQAIMRSIRYKDRAIVLPGQVGEMAYSWSTRYSKLQAALKRTPTMAELADAFHVSMADMELFLERGGHVGSLDCVPREGHGSSLLDLVPDEASLDGDEALERALAEEQSQALRSALYCLGERERQMVEMRYGLNGAAPCTLREIGEKTGVSRERIRQILDVSYRRLRVHMVRMPVAAVEAVPEMAGVGRPLP